MCRHWPHGKLVGGMKTTHLWVNEAPIPALNFSMVEYWGWICCRKRAVVPPCVVYGFTSQQCPAPGNVGREVVLNLVTCFMAMGAFASWRSFFVSAAVRLCRPCLLSSILRRKYSSRLLIQCWLAFLTRALFTFAILSLFGDS